MSFDLFPQRKSLLNYSTAPESRAQLFDSFEHFASMPVKRRSKRGKKRTTGRKRIGRLSMNKGLISIKLGKSIHKFRAGALLTEIPLTRIRTAAKKVLRKSSPIGKKKGRKLRRGRKKRA
jgi:hypothetical protein